MGKFGIHLALWARNWSDDILPFARKAAAIAFDGVEISLLGDVARTPVDIGKAIADMGLARMTTTGLARDTDIASADAAIRRRGIETLRAAIRTTHALGARQLSGVIYGAWGMNDGPNKPARVERAIAGLQEVAGLFARARDRMRGDVDDEVAADDLRHFAGALCGMAQCGPEARHQFADAERLVDVVVGAEVEAAIFSGVNRRAIFTPFAEAMRGGGERRKSRSFRRFGACSAKSRGRRLRADRGFGTHADAQP